MEQTLISHPALKVRARTGSEGPHHDPYAFTEFAIKTPTASVTIHEGLGTWVKYDERVWIVTEPEAIANLWVQVTGFTFKQIQRIARKKSERCNKCGGREFYCESGMPGETFFVCKCGNVVDGWFDLSAVI